MDIEDLSFIGRRKKGEPGGTPRHFWRVKPTGDYGADCKIGQRLALEYLAYEEASLKKPGGGATILALIVGDMPRETTGIEVAFMQMVAFAAVEGAGRARRIAAYWAECEAKELSAA